MGFLTFVPRFLRPEIRNHAAAVERSCAAGQGQARPAHCLFRVPINGELTSRCEVNALGIRDAYSASLTSEIVSVG
jgi:hypothetical protein